MNILNRKIEKYETIILAAYVISMLLFTVLLKFGDRSVFTMVLGYISFAIPLFIMWYYVISNQNAILSFFIFSSSLFFVGMVLSLASIQNGMIFFIISRLSVPLLIGVIYLYSVRTRKMQRSILFLITGLFILIVAVTILPITIFWVQAPIHDTVSPYIYTVILALIVYLVFDQQTYSIDNQVKKGLISVFLIHFAVLVSGIGSL
jgi:hypothetical protein